MPAIPSISVWPAIGIVVAVAVVFGVLFALLDTRLLRTRPTEEPLEEIVLPGTPDAATSQTVLEQLTTAPEEPRDLRRSA